MIKVRTTCPICGFKETLNKKNQFGRELVICYGCSQTYAIQWDAEIKIKTVIVNFNGE